MLPNPFDDQPSQVRAKIAIIYALLITANVGVWIWAWIAFANRPAMLGMALLAYMFGLRHAFDADHIAAIDNVVRKLIQEGKSPYTVGGFFSLGHSTIVILASIGIAIAASAIHNHFGSLQEIGSLIGTTVSAMFLLIIGIANLFALKSTFSTFARAREGEEISDEQLDAVLAGRGFLARVFRPLFRIVSRSWHMYLIGFLFGLGFDTATEIGLLGISAAQAAQGMSLWTLLVFPALFTASMSLMDTTDSALMTGAYGWAFVNPIRKLWYNLTITAASVVVALFIGGLEVLGLVSDKLGLEGGLWSIIGGLNGSLTKFGYVVVGIFIATWIVSSAVYRARNYEGRDSQKTLDSAVRI